jgi:mannan endo-1,4-beta-mannosidase
MRKLISVLAGTVAALLVYGTASASSALPFGLYESSNDLQYSFAGTPNYAVQYYGWQEAFQATDAQDAWNAGTESFLELQTCGNPCNLATSVSLANVIAGNYDTYLTNFAAAAAAFGHPVLMTFDHEMNGSWYPWDATDGGTSTGVTPAQWIAAWDHVTSLISAIAPNVAWVWAPNIEQGGSAVSAFWPGPGGQVSYVGLDGYYANTGSAWSHRFQPSYLDVESASGGSYPFMVTETGIPSADANAVSQVDDLFSGARSVGAVAVMYFDKGAYAMTAAMESEFVADAG